MIPAKLKKTIAVLGLVVPLTCFAAGEIDNKTLSVTATLPEVIKITFASGTTIALGDLISGTPPVNAILREPFCVGYNSGTSYSVEVHSTNNAGGAFALTRNGDGTTDPIPMLLSWDPAVVSTLPLTPNVPRTGVPTADGILINLQVASCPVRTNGDLTILIDPNDITGKVAGYFSDSLLVTVTGE